jgi:hypothetical protein
MVAMSDQLSPAQSLALGMLKGGPFIVNGRGRWVPKWYGGDSYRHGFKAFTITTLEHHGLVTINGGKACITARGKRFLDAEGK